MSTDAGVEKSPEVRLAWARYWARSIDILLYSLVIVIPVVLVARDIALASPVLLNLLLIPLALVLDAVVIGAFGTSVGKHIAGVKVQGAGGGPPGVLAGIHRNLRIYLALGFGLPVIGQVLLLLEYFNLRRSGATSWDRIAGTRVVSVGATAIRTAFAGFVFFALGAVLAVGAVFDRPHTDAVSATPRPAETAARGPATPPQTPAATPRRQLERDLSAVRSRLPIRIDDDLTLYGVEVGAAVLNYLYETTSDPAGFRATREATRVRMLHDYCGSSAVAATDLTTRYIFYFGETRLGDFLFRSADCTAVLV